MNEQGKKILVISAHAVDFLWRCGGTIRKSADEGATVKIVDLTFGERGESSHVWRTQENVTVEEVKEIRRKEATEIAAALGAASIEFYDWGDHPLAVDEARVLQVARLLQEFQPNVILTHMSSDPLNYDHPFAAECVFRAVRLAQVPGSTPENRKKTIGKLEIYMFEPDQPEMCHFDPDFFVDITSVMDKKIAAMNLAASQTYLIHNYTVRAEYRGYLAGRIAVNSGIKYAEAYRRFYPQVVESL